MVSSLVDTNGFKTFLLGYPILHSTLEEILALDTRRCPGVDAAAPGPWLSLPALCRISGPASQMQIVRSQTHGHSKVRTRLPPPGIIALETTSPSTFTANPSRAGTDEDWTCEAVSTRPPYSKLYESESACVFRKRPTDAILRTILRAWTSGGEPETERLLCRVRSTRGIACEPAPTHRG